MRRVLFTDVPRDSASESALKAAGLAVGYLDPLLGDSVVQQGMGASVIVNGFTEIDEATIDALPDLRLIALTSMGADMVDVDAASARGIIVTSIPADSAAEEVATHAFGMLLSVIRNITASDRAVQEGGWSEYQPAASPRLSEQTLGVIGAGHIGRRLVEEFGPHFSRVLVHDPYLEEAPPGAELVDKQTLLARSDAVSLHVPLNPRTYHLLDADAIAGMRQGCVLINVGRGALLDERALRAALDSGHIAGAALDVLEHEPPTDRHPLIGHPRVVVTPHIAYHSSSSARRYRDIPVRNAIAWSRGEDLISIINGAQL
ncbi:hypothetical protein GCM10027408_21860 [Microbacterium tumbae]